MSLQQVQAIALQLGISIGDVAAGGLGRSQEDLIADILQNPGYKPQGGGGEKWDDIELPTDESIDLNLLKMTNNPNKFLKEKVYEFYGVNDEMYMFGLMNSIYYYLDYVNEITVYRDILDIIKNAYDKAQGIPLELLKFDSFKEGYYVIKQKKINQYYEESQKTTLNLEGNLLAANAEQQKKLNAFFKEANRVNEKFGEFAMEHPQEAASMLLSAAGTPAGSPARVAESGTNPRTFAALEITRSPIARSPINTLNNRLVPPPMLPRAQSSSLETQANSTSPGLEGLTGANVSPLLLSHLPPVTPLVPSSPGFENLQVPVAENKRPVYTPIQVNKSRSRRRAPTPGDRLFLSPIPEWERPAGGSRKYRKTRKSRKGTV